VAFLKRLFRRLLIVGVVGVMYLLCSNTTIISDETILILFTFLF